MGKNPDTLSVCVTEHPRKPLMPKFNPSKLKVQLKLAGNQHTTARHRHNTH